LKITKETPATHLSLFSPAFEIKSMIFLQESYRTSGWNVEPDRKFHFFDFHPQFQDVKNP